MASWDGVLKAGRTAHHVVLHARAADSEQLDSFQGACSCYDGICGGDGWYDVLHHTASQLPRHSLHVKFCRSAYVLMLLTSQHQ